jgi:hypothetical protein
LSGRVAHHPECLPCSLLFRAKGSPIACGRHRTTRSGCAAKQPPYIPLDDDSRAVAEAHPLSKFVQTAPYGAVGGTGWDRSRADAAASAPAHLIRTLNEEFAAIRC